MEYLYGIGIIAGILFFLLIFIPVAMVKYTEWESDENHPVNITNRYVEKIGWETAINQQLSLFGFWGLIVVLANRYTTLALDAFLLWGFFCGLSGYWFFRSFKGLFKSSSHWYDNSVVMSTLLVSIALLQNLNVIGFFFSLFLGATVSIWWAGRLMMYKAIRDQNA